MFFRIFMSLFTNKELEDIATNITGKLYTYNSINNTFNKLNGKEIIPNSMMEEACRNVYTLPPIYLSGKYHRPRITNFNVSDLLKSMKFCPEPNFMMNVAHFILYHLTTKLEENE